MDMLSEGAGEKPGFVLLGELECDDGVGRFLGEVAFECGCSGGGNVAPGSVFGAMLEFDRRD